MTHAEITAALRDDFETHREVYRSRRLAAGRPDALAAWRRTNSRSRQECVAGGGQGGREIPAVESVVTQGTRLEESGPRPESRVPQSFQAARCECGHPVGDHNPIIGAGVFAQQAGRCMRCPACAGFVERP